MAGSACTLPCGQNGVTRPPNGTHAGEARQKQQHDAVHENRPPAMPGGDGWVDDAHPSAHAFSPPVEPAPVSCSDAEALQQIRLLATARCLFQMTRICMGPLMVSMSAEYGYSQHDKGHMLAAFAAGYSLTQVIGGMVADRLGGASVIAFGLMSSALALLLLPRAADLGPTYAWWLLWVMGFTQGPTYPAQLVTTAKWVTGSLRSYASALGGAASTAGSLVALALTPVIAVRIGWRQAAFAMGTATLAFAAVWHSRGRSSPASIVQGVIDRAVQAPAGAVEPPSRNSLGRALRVLLAPPVLATFGAHSVHNFVRYFLMGWLPTYYDEILRVPVDVAGLHLMLGELVGLVVGVCGAHLGRCLQDSGTLSALTVRRLFATLAFMGAGFGLVLVSAAQQATAATAALCIVQGVATLQGLGFGASYLDVSLHQGGLVTGVGNTVATGASFAAPVFALRVLSGADIGHAPPGAVDREGWRQLFLAFAASNAVGWLVYVPFISTTPVDLDEASTPDAGDKVKLKAV